MAKVTAPLLSLSASGAFAKTLVSSTWKGIKYMRSYVVPANPKTAAQTVQRNFFTALVAEWHNILRLAVDKLAYDKRASIQRLTMSGFNVFMQIYRTVQVAGDTLIYFYDMAGVWSAGSKDVTITGDCSAASHDCQAYFYDASGSLLGEGPISSEADKSFDTEVDFEMTVAPAYVKIITDTAASGGESGYYAVTTGA